MVKINKRIYISLLLLIFSLNFCAQKGLVVSPVADLAGQPLGSRHTYQQLPWAARGSDYAACPRVHQLLFHETVEILEKCGDEIKVRVPNLFYQTMKSNNPQTDYWTLVDNIRGFDGIAKKEQNKIPTPIRCNNFQAAKQQITTLIAPYYDRKTKMTLSAGSRFVCAKRSKRKARVLVYRFNPKHGVHDIISIPQKLLYRSKQTKPDLQRAEFVQILRSWAHTAGTIPYVWGGCSFTETHAANTFHAVPKQNGGYYTRKGDQKRNPKTGLDCTGIIARAAQIVGLPYFLKNSYTIAHNLPLLRPDKHLQPGDIIWLPGHVIVISDTKNNLVVEAHAYDSGYGRVHELPISRIFKDIKTFKDLEIAFRKQIPLGRLDSKGEVFARYPIFKLLRIPVATAVHL